jgi:hypothetical protein
MEPPASTDEKSSGADKRVPPHTCLPVWIDRFFDAAREVNTSRVTKEFIGANVVGSGHQAKVLVALRFLGLIDKEGNGTNRLRALRVVGDEFATHLSDVVQQAYSELLSTVSIKTASYDGLINFLMQRYSMSQPQADSAARFFLHLASNAHLELGAQLLAAGSPKLAHGEKERRAQEPMPQRRESSNKPKASESTSSDYATIDGPFGRIRIIDRSTLDLARKLLDMIEEKMKKPVVATS